MIGCATPNGRLAFHVGAIAQALSADQVARFLIDSGLPPKVEVRCFFSRSARSVAGLAPFAMRLLAGLLGSEMNFLYQQTRVLGYVGEVDVISTGASAGRKTVRASDGQLVPASSIGNRLSWGPAHHAALLGAGEAFDRMVPERPLVDDDSARVSAPVRAQRAARISYDSAPLAAPQNTLGPNAPYRVDARVLRYAAAVAPLELVEVGNDGVLYRDGWGSAFVQSASEPECWYRFPARDAPLANGSYRVGNAHAAFDVMQGRLTLLLAVEEGLYYTSSRGTCYFLNTASNNWYRVPSFDDFEQFLAP